MLYASASPVVGVYAVSTSPWISRSLRSYLSKVATRGRTAQPRAMRAGPKGEVRSLVVKGRRIVVEGGRVIVVETALEALQKGLYE